MKKRICLLIVIVVVCTVFYLTFQNADETNLLTYQTMRLLERIGLKIQYKPLRHYIHYFEYFVVGLSISSFLMNNKWSYMKTILLSVAGGAVIGTVDEIIKIWLPIREFDLGDLMRDYAGVVIGVLIAVGVKATISKASNKG